MRPPIRIRSFILGSVLVLLVAPTLAGGAGWLIERDHQHDAIQQRLNTAVGYLTTHRNDLKASLPAFASLLARLDLLAALSGRAPTLRGKAVLYLSPALQPTGDRGSAAVPGVTALSETRSSWSHDRRLIPGVWAGSPATLVADLYYRPASDAARTIVALVSGLVVLFAGLAVAVWLAGRWMVNPLTRLSSQVDKVAGGDLAITVPRSRIGEITNIAQAIEGMTAALSNTEQARVEADQARRFLITSIAHDLRTPLFALRGHLQALHSNLGDPAVHLGRAEARADALERLIGNLFAYSRDDYAQPVPQFETVPVAEVVQEVTSGIEHAAHRRGNTLEIHGDRELSVIVDRDRLKRALTNILDNAIRHSPAGAPIHLSWECLDDSHVEITVQDHGAGIDPNLLPHIFEPGIRGTMPNGASDGGAGLGLAIAKRLLEHQHATLTADNHPPAGARISLTLKRPPSHNPDRD
jgi:signal transduction histidine kinase